MYGKMVKVVKKTKNKEETREKTQSEIPTPRKVDIHLKRKFHMLKVK